MNNNNNETHYHWKLYTLDGQFIEESNDWPDNFTGMCINDCSNKFWYKNGLWHREDGPAIENDYESPAKQWYLFDIECSEQQHKLLVDLMKLKNLL